MAKTAKRTDPELWRRVVARVKAGSRGGFAGQWSARKAQLAVKEYNEAGGGYVGPKDPNLSLAKWTRQKWRTKSGKPSLESGERYLPAKAIAALSPSEYAATTREKRKGLRRGEQFTKQPQSIARKVKRFRRNDDRDGAYLTAFAAIVAVGIAAKILVRDAATIFA